jgi:hypothetical protein
VTPEEYGDFAHAAHAWCEGRKKTAEGRWSFLRRGKWFYDNEARTMRFYDPPDVPGVIADANVVGSFSRRTNSWMWVLGNERYSDAERSRTNPVRVFGEVRGIPQLSEAHWSAEEVDGWEVAQIAAYLLQDVEAVYRAPMDHLFVFMHLRNFRLEPGATVPGNEKNGFFSRLWRGSGRA